MATSRGTADFTPQIDSWLANIGEDTLLFKKGDSPIEKVKNKYIVIFRNALENAKRPKGKGHIGSTRKLYSELGEGWEFVQEGNSASLILRLPEYWYYTDKGRGRSNNKKGGLVQQALSYQSSSLRGWIAAKGLVPSSGMEFKYKRKLTNGTVKTYTRKLDAKQANRALSFMIAKKIHKEGYQGSGWFSDTIGDFEKEMVQAVEEQFGKDVVFNLIIANR